MQKYILCRPLGGLNDSLCQIKSCYDYSKKTNRILLIDTLYAQLNISFHELFTFIDDINIIYNSYEIKTLIINITTTNNCTIYPTEITNLYSNQQWSSINFTEEYKEDIILHCYWGSGQGINTLKLLQLNDNIIQYIIQKYVFILKPYISIHIRNTDYKTNYQELYEENSEIINNNNLFLATDSREVLNYFQENKLKKNINNNNLYSFITCLNNANDPIHTSYNITVLQDTICDLLLLSLSEKLIYPNKYQGFTSLAISLFNNKQVIYQLLKIKELNEMI